MKNQLGIAFILLCLTTGTQAQQLFIPQNFIKSAEKGMRSYTGKPGEKYFQNKADYRIEASFDPVTAILEGKEKIIYVNNSSDTLKKIVVRLYQNLFKAEAIRQIDIVPSDIDQGVRIASIKLNGIEYPQNKISYAGTNAILNLPKHLQPNNSIQVDIEWGVQLPKKTYFRFGRTDSTTYFVAYWYPQIAVYDDINGWNTDTFTGLQEFYNDFNSFDVKLTLPAKQMIWATGELMNTDNILTKRIIDNITEAKLSDKITKIIGKEDYQQNAVFKTDKSNTWHFKATNVTDFAFGTSNRYIWHASSIQLDKNSSERVMVNAVYAADTVVGKQIVEIARRSIERISSDILGVKYPFPHMTIYEGTGGTEFPMMCNDEFSSDLKTNAFITSHEVFHSYFPFTVGTNETLYAWIDEGLTTLIPKDIEEEYGNTNAHYYIAAYAKKMGTVMDVPLSVPSTCLSPANYMMQNYGRAAAGFYLLRELAGKETFKITLKTFAEEWRGKHPTPTDLLFTLNRISGKDYSWFWQKWLYEYGFADLYFRNVSTKNGKLSITICNKGILPVPIKLNINYKDGTKETVYQDASIWKDRQAWKIERKVQKPIEKLTLGDSVTPDSNPTNNTYTL